MPDGCRSLGDVSLFDAIAPIVINDVAKRHMHHEMLPDDDLDHIFNLTGMHLRGV